MRARCARCGRALCCCAALDQTGVPVASAVRLLILQHPREQHEPKGTARLLHLAVAGSTLLVGEHWPSDPEAAGAADGPGLSPGSSVSASPGPRTLLLYPPTPGDAQLAEPPPWPPRWPRHGLDDGLADGLADGLSDGLTDALADPTGLRLVVIDGTWRKSRRMLYGSPWLQGLPRLGLSDPPPSRYAIRRARGDGQRSTFEAAALALQALGQPVAALWPVFEAFVAQQQAVQQAVQQRHRAA